NWSYPFSVATLPQAVTYTVNSEAVDGAGNVEKPGPSTSFLLVDTTPPVSTITFPAAAAYSTATWSGAITGSATDNTGVSGVASVGVSIFNGNSYWNGTAFASATPVLNSTTLNANGTWSYTFS